MEFFWPGIIIFNGPRQSFATLEIAEIFALASFETHVKIFLVFISPWLLKCALGYTYNFF